jgi:DNA-binding transcriptional ArsR family regulator
MDMAKRNLRQWATIFRGFGNPSRLRILELLRLNSSMSVSALAESLGITIKNTSRNLNILQNLDILESEGKDGHVFYRLNRSLEGDVSKILRLILPKD